MGMRDRLGAAAADAYQFVGRHDSPAFVLNFLHWLCRALDPVKVPHDCINPAMVRGLSRSLGIALEDLFGEEADGVTTAALGKSNAFLEFLTDSPEQITESIERTGLRGKIDRAFQAAIARARRSRRKSSALTMNRTVEVDPEKDNF